MENGIYTDIDEFIAAVEQSDEISRDLELEGVPMGKTIGTLIEMYENNFDLTTVVSSSHHDTPYPLGAEFRAASAHEFADITKELGGSCIKDIEKNEDGSVQIGYHFD